MLTKSITPTKKSELVIDEPGEYWVEAKIENNNEILSVYKTIQIEKVEPKENNFTQILNFPEKPILIISAIMIVMVIVGLSVRRL